MIHDKVLHRSIGENPLLEEARRLAPMLSGKGADNEANGKLSDEAVEAMREAGFFSMMVPKEVGGMDLTPVQVLATVEAMCNIDTATGWVMMASNVATASAAAWLPDSAFDKLFGHGRSIVAGAGAPTGKAEVVEGGYRLTGRWAYGSGCYHCDYFHSGAVVTEGGKPRMIPGTQTPETLIFITPRDKMEFLGNWDVIGLRGTGSIDYGCTDLFVPAEMTHSAAKTAGLRGSGGYGVGVVGFSAIGHTGFALGHGRRILDELSALVHSPNGRPSALANLGGSDSFKENYARAEGNLRAARALCYDVWNDITETTNKGEPASVRQISWARVALNHATDAMIAIATFAHKASGGISLRDGALQRALRDALAGGQHVMVADKALQEAGRDFLGLIEGEVRWTPRGLVPV